MTINWKAADRHLTKQFERINGIPFDWPHEVVYENYPPRIWIKIWVPLLDQRRKEKYVEGRIVVAEPTATELDHITKFWDVVLANTTKVRAKRHRGKSDGGYLVYVVTPQYNEFGGK